MSVRRLTPAGPGGVAVIEVRGGEALQRLGALLEVDLPAVGHVALVRLLERGPQAGPTQELLDEALILRRGTELVEVCLHGNPVLVGEIMERLGLEGGAAAQEGLPQDTVEQRAWARLPRVPSEAGARILLDQAEGALRREALAWARGEVSPSIGWVRRWRRAAPLLEPPVVVLAGPTNAGKSTLFNLLVGEQRVAVGAQPGTTRDTISALVPMGDVPVLLVDTAGEPDSGEAGSEDDRGDPVEREGQRLARGLRARADLILFLRPEGASDPPRPDGGVPTLVLTSQADQCWAAGLENPDWIRPTDAISAHLDPEHARSLVETLVPRELGCGGEQPHWVPGRGVPFEASVAEALERASHLSAGPARVAAIVPWLDGEPGGPSPEPPPR